MPGLGYAPTASFTPVPGQLTPVLTPMPMTGYHTPVPGAVPAAALPSSTQPVSLADAPPIPRNWIKVGVVVIALLLSGGDDAGHPNAVVVPPLR